MTEHEQLSKIFSERKRFKDHSGGHHADRPYRRGHPSADESDGNQRGRTVDRRIQSVPHHRQDGIPDLCVFAGGRLFSHAQQREVFRTSPVVCAALRAPLRYGFLREAGVRKQPECILDAGDRISGDLGAGGAVRAVCGGLEAGEKERDGVRSQLLGGQGKGVFSGFGMSSRRHTHLRRMAYGGDFADGLRRIRRPADRLVLFREARESLAGAYLPGRLPAVSVGALVPVRLSADPVLQRDEKACRERVPVFFLSVLSGTFVDFWDYQGGFFGQLMI